VNLLAKFLYLLNFFGQLFCETLFQGLQGAYQYRSTKWCDKWFTWVFAEE